MPALHARSVMPIYMSLCFLLATSLSRGPILSCSLARSFSPLLMHTYTGKHEHHTYACAHTYTHTLSLSPSLPFWDVHTLALSLSLEAILRTDLVPFGTREYLKYVFSRHRSQFQASYYTIIPIIIVIIVTSSSSLSLPPSSYHHHYHPRIMIITIINLAISLVIIVIAVRNHYQRRPQSFRA